MSAKSKTLGFSKRGLTPRAWNLRQSLRELKPKFYGQIKTHHVTRIKNEMPDRFIHIERGERVQYVKDHEGEYVMDRVGIKPKIVRNK